MTMLALRPREVAVPPLLMLAFRPFFLAAALWSVIALLIWIVSLLAGTALPSRFDPLSWHFHEMLFGFVPPAIAGFLLTAIPTWTGRRPIQGGTLSPCCSHDVTLLSLKKSRSELYNSGTSPKVCL